MNWKERDERHFPRPDMIDSCDDDSGRGPVGLIPLSVQRGAFPFSAMAGYDSRERIIHIISENLLNRNTHKACRRQPRMKDTT